ncbi:hypothetical protein Syun_016658 [Stephania yunnanensis]|uniref:Uncharacterized protein n=1 Tax=Stephania yunnanensis TaxID=152371 RepID=A0AAP0J7V6_9MAGN
MAHIIFSTDVLYRGSYIYGYMAVMSVREGKSGGARWLYGGRGGASASFSILGGAGAAAGVLGSAANAVDSDDVDFFECILVGDAGWGVVREVRSVHGGGGGFLLVVQCSF